MTVDGVRVASCVDTRAFVWISSRSLRATSLEFVATFTGDPYQHSGLGQTLEPRIEPFALFSTLSGGSLTLRRQLRSACGRRSATAETATNLGTAFLERAAPLPHRLAAVAGRLLGRRGAGGHAPGRDQRAMMRPVAASDFNAFSGNDRRRLDPPVAVCAARDRSCRASSTARPRNWDKHQLGGGTPGRHVARHRVSAPGHRLPDGTWTPFVTIAAPGALTLQSRYIQYPAQLATADRARHAVAMCRHPASGAALPPDSAAADGPDDHLPSDWRRRRLVIRRSRSRRRPRPVCR